MPEGLGSVIGLLVLGYLLLLLELFVPGGILGIMGMGAVALGCYLAFDLGRLWGAGAIALSVGVTVGGVIAFFRSNASKRLMLMGNEAAAWKAAGEDLASLTGQLGRTLSPLRPAGLAQIGGRRIDVVSDSEFLEAGIPVRVSLVEGNRVVVEAVAEEKAGGPAGEAP